MNKQWSQPQPAPKVQDKQAGDGGLWVESTRWRNLTLTAAGLTAAAGAFCLPLFNQTPAPASGGPARSPSPVRTHAKPSPAPKVEVAASSQVGKAPLALRSGVRTGQAPLAAPAQLAAPRPLTMADASPASEALQLEPQPQACTLRSPAVPFPLGEGTVVSFEARSVSQTRIHIVQQKIGGLIDPAYAYNQRVIVRMADGQRKVLLQPLHLTVHIGDRVTAQDSYRNASLPCNYIPNLITGDLGPEPKTAVTKPSESQAMIVPKQIMPADIPKASTETRTTQDTCPIALSYDSGRFAEGVVTQEVPSNLALASIARDEVKAHARIDPTYVDVRRVIVTINAHAHPSVVIPPGMAVKIGDRLAVHEARRSHAVPCGWVPNIATDDFGPEPAGGDSSTTRGALVSK